MLHLDKTFDFLNKEQIVSAVLKLNLEKIFNSNDP